MLPTLKILEVIEEQISVRFTGKVNVLSRANRQYLGQLLFKDGEILQASFQSNKGLKAFYQLIIQQFTLEHFDFVVEPEVVEERERNIHYPYGVLKNKIAEILKQYRDSLKFRPPGNIRIILEAEFISDTLPVSSTEFSVMKCLTEWSSPDDIYQHCQHLDHEITLALVSLRKKGALKIIGDKNNL